MILFIDDEEALARMTGNILERLGYRVETHTDPLAALERFQASPGAFDLVITDMTMPRLTGVALAKQIKRLRPEIPVILCTGHSSEIGRQRALQPDIAALLHKPVVKTELAQTIRNILDASAQQPQA